MIELTFKAEGSILISSEATSVMFLHYFLIFILIFQGAWTS